MRRSLSIACIKEVDKSGMLQVLLDFPQQCEAAYTIAENASLLLEKRDFAKIVFTALGGSAAGGELVKSYLYFDSKLPISVLGEYELPAYIDSSTLVFVLSYSGETEETLAAYASAREKGATIIVISSDGALKEEARRDRITFVELPAGLAPRCALGYLSIIPLCILARLGLAPDIKDSLYQAVKTLEELKTNHLHPRIGQKDNIAKYTASKLLNKFIVVYASSIYFDAVRINFRSQLNENAKVLASSHVFPEMNHNEIMGWQNPQKLFKDFVVVMLRDKGIHPRVNKRMDLTLEILRSEGVKTLEIWSRGENALSRIFSLVYMGSFISFYLAILYGIDPTPVDKITYLKKRLTEVS